jgi:hypothetical protein
MKKKLFLLLFILIVAIIATVWYGYSFFSVRLNFYNSSHAIYTNENIYSIESKIKATTLNKSEHGIWISDLVYFQNIGQLHFAIITKEDNMFKVRAILSSESDKLVHREFFIFRTSRFLMFKSYQVYFELPELVQGEKYTLEIKKISLTEQEAEQLETMLGKVDFIIE